MIHFSSIYLRKSTCHVSEQLLLNRHCSAWAQAGSSQANRSSWSDHRQKNMLEYNSFQFYLQFYLLQFPNHGVWKVEALTVTIMALQIDIGMLFAGENTNINKYTFAQSKQAEPF